MELDAIWFEECQIHFILSDLILWRGSYLGDIVQKHFNNGLHVDIYRPVSFKHGMIKGTSKLYLNSSLNDLDLHSRLQFLEKETSVLVFSLYLDEIWHAAMTCRSFQAHTNFIGMINIESRGLYLCNFKKNMFEIGLCGDALKPMTFIFGMMMDMSKVHLLNDLDVHSRSQGCEKA